jgi:hypothetical protein
MHPAVLLERPPIALAPHPVSASSSRSRAASASGMASNAATSAASAIVSTNNQSRMARTGFRRVQHQRLAPCPRVSTDRHRAGACRSRSTTAKLPPRLGLDCYGRGLDAFVVRRSIRRGPDAARCGKDQGPRWVTSWAISFAWFDRAAALARDPHHAAARWPRSPPPSGSSRPTTPRISAGTCFALQGDPRQRRVAPLTIADPGDHGRRDTHPPTG